MTPCSPVRRVALFTRLASRGAFGAAFAGVAWALRAHGVERVDVLHYGDAVDPARSGYPENAAFIRLKGGRGLRVVGELRRYLERDAPDFLISAPLYLNLVAIAASLGSRWRRRGGGLIITHNHPIELSHRNSWKDNKWLARVLYRFAAGSYAISPELIDDARRHTGLDPRRIACIPCALAPAALPEEESTHPWLDRKDGFAFVTVSRLVPLKNVELLIRAFAELVRVREARLLIAGDGPERARLAALVETLGLAGRVALCGYVKSARLFMKRADAFVLASDEEGFGQVLSEAMSVGCPVISTRARGGGTEYVLGGGEHGMLVPCGDRAALRDAMLAMMEATTRREYAARARGRAEAFRPERVGAELLEYLQSCRP